MKDNNLYKQAYSGYIEKRANYLKWLKSMYSAVKGAPKAIKGVKPIAGIKSIDPGIIMGSGATSQLGSMGRFGDLVAAKPMYAAGTAFGGDVLGRKMGLWN